MPAEVQNKASFLPMISNAGYLGVDNGEIQKTVKTRVFFCVFSLFQTSATLEGVVFSQVKDDENWTSIEVKDLGEKGFGIAAWFVNFW